MNNADVRAYILREFYDQEMKGAPRAIDLEEFGKKLGVPKRQVEVAFKYLVDTGLLDGYSAVGSDVPWVSGITAAGLDVVDNPQKHSQSYEINQQIIQVEGNIYGSIAQAQDNSQITQTVNTFEELHRLIDQHAELTKSETIELKSRIKELEQELGQEQISKPRISSLLQHLKKYSWLYSIVTQLLIKVLLNSK